MIGLLCSLAAWLPAWLIARREARHEAIQMTFQCAAWWCFATIGSAGWSRLTLIGMGLIPFCAALSYQSAWGKPSLETLWSLGVGAGMAVSWGAFVTLAPNPEAWWFYASWAPYVASVTLGWTLLAKWAKVKYFYSPRLRFLGRNIEYQPDVPWTISQRIAALMLFADTIGLAFVRLPGYSEAIGRASLVLIALVQVGWLIKSRNAPRSV